MWHSPDTSACRYAQMQRQHYHYHYTWCTTWFLSPFLLNINNTRLIIRMSCQQLPMWAAFQTPGAGLKRFWFVVISGFYFSTPLQKDRKISLSYWYQKRFWFGHFFTLTSLYSVYHHYHPSVNLPIHLSTHPKVYLSPLHPFIHPSGSFGRSVCTRGISSEARDEMEITAEIMVFGFRVTRRRQWEFKAAALITGEQCALRSDWGEWLTTGSEQSSWEHWI